MPLVPPPENRPDGVLWWTFKHQTWLGHALVVIAGLAFWLGTYALWLALVEGGLELAATSTPAAMAARRSGIRAASTVCWLWFSLAVMVGKGGPFLNVGLYPTGALVVGPYVSALVAFGRLPDAMFTPGSPLSGAFLVHGLGLFLPGFLLSLLVLGGFTVLKVHVTGTHEEWATKHMRDDWLPDEFWETRR